VPDGNASYGKRTLGDIRAGFLSYKPAWRTTNFMNGQQLQARSEPMDDAELRTQLEEHHAMSYGWALSYCSSNPGDAEDILHTVYQKILEGRARYDGRSAFKTWLFAVIRNTAAEERRRGWLRHLRIGGYAKEHEHDIQPAERGAGLENAESLTAFRAALERLPRRQREVLHLVFYQDLTVEAAAGVMRVSVGSARTHYERGKRRLGEWLKKSGHFDER
jgi:RNA polymerase sigma-70 factor (ECF subfamily)